MTRQQMLNDGWRTQHRSGKCRCLRVGVVPVSISTFPANASTPPRQAQCWSLERDLCCQRKTGHWSPTALDLEFELKLARKASGKAVDGFVRSEAFGSSKVQTDRGSYQENPGLEERGGGILHIQAKPRRMSFSIWNRHVISLFGHGRRICQALWPMTMR